MRARTCRPNASAALCKDGGDFPGLSNSACWACRRHVALHSHHAPSELEAIEKQDERRPEKCFASMWSCGLTKSQQFMAHGMDACCNVYSSPERSDYQKMPVQTPAEILRLEMASVYINLKVSHLCLMHLTFPCVLCVRLLESRRSQVFRWRPSHTRSRRAGSSCVRARPFSDIRGG